VYKFYKYDARNSTLSHSSQINVRLDESFTTADIAVQQAMPVLGRLIYLIKAQKNAMQDMPDF
jgi:hypothetical protein